MHSECVPFLLPLSQTSLVEVRLPDGSSEKCQFQPQSFSILGNEVLKVENFQIATEHHQKSPLLHFFFLLRLVILKAMGIAIAQGWHSQGKKISRP